MNDTSVITKIYRRPIAVAGATGKQGGAVVTRLLERGHNVRALTRSPEKPAAESLAKAGAEVVKADLEDRASIETALTGAAAVFSVQDFLEAGVEAEVRQGLNLTEAAATIGVEHLVYSGASTMDRNTSVPHLDSKWRIEQRVRSINIPWTVLRPSAFMENWQWDRDTIVREGVVPLPGRPDMTYRQVSVRDIAAMAVMAFERPDVWVGRVVALAGDALTPVEIAETFSRVMGRDLRFKQIDWETCRAMQGEDLTLMYRYFDQFGMDGDPKMLKHWHPDALTFEAFLRIECWDKLNASA